MTKINYQEALKNAAQMMVGVQNPAHLLKMITRFLDKEMGVAHASIIVHDPERDFYVFFDSKGEAKLPVKLIRLDRNNSLIKWFVKMRGQKSVIKKDFISIPMIDGILKNESILACDTVLRDKLLKIKDTMKTLKAYLCVPGYYKDELLGIFILGKKNDKTEFVTEDISFFQTLASDVSMCIKNAEYQQRLLEKINELTGSLMEIQRLREQDKNKFLQMILTLAQMVDARDPYTYGHSEEVERYGMLTALEIKLDLEMGKKQTLSTALLLHDVGKLGVPDAILHKKGPLTENEWRKMRDHARIGAQILEQHEDLREVSVIIMHHHENYDGTGYPYKLKGDEIPIQSRIISVVDSFHAMVSDRPYRQGLSYDYAISELERCSGTQFDPKIVEAFKRVLSKELSLDSY